jgi:cytochrome c peroxidase
MNLTNSLPKTVLASSVVSCLLILSSCGSSEYKKEEGNKGKQVASILKENGCMECHSASAPKPFYVNFPIIGKTVQKDIIEGIRYVDLTAMVDALQNGKPITETDLTKVEYATLGDKMPPAKYTAMHWGTSLDSDEKAIVIDWAKETRAAHFKSNSVAAEFSNEPLQPLTMIETDPQKVALGNKLFHDTRLSADNTISCATCHGLHTGGVDRIQFSEGIAGQFGGINAPTVYNSAFNFVQFWDGRAADLKEQAAGPPLNPIEMGHTSFDNIIAALAQDDAFTKEFNAVYSEGLTQSSITDAIAEFEKTLLTPSRFDKYLQGDKKALTADEIAGYDIFKQNDCASCHVGVNIGGQSYEYMGIKDSYFDYRGTGLTDGDNGRYSVTKDEADRHKFKTPTLRNIAITYPYMHDGSVETLEEAIKYMHTFQIGSEINEKDMAQLIAFLKSLTGEYNGKMLN